MMTFVYYFSLSFLGGMLLSGGAGHLARFVHFRNLLHQHGVLPAGSATIVSILVTGFELSVGMSALWALWHIEALRGSWSVLWCGAAAGYLFLFYVQRLLHRGGAVNSCGCSPLAGPLTGASIIPAAAMLLISVLGLLSAGFRAPDAAGEIGAFSWWLPALWGLAFSGIVLLVPATMPPPEERNA